MIRLIPFTWGQAATPTQVAVAQWVWQADATGLRTIPVRIRTGYQVETGHSESADPLSDTRED